MKKFTSVTLFDQLKNFKFSGNSLKYFCANNPKDPNSNKNETLKNNKPSPGIAEKAKEVFYNAAEKLGVKIPMAGGNASSSGGYSQLDASEEKSSGSGRSPDANNVNNSDQNLGNREKVKMKYTQESEDKDRSRIPGMDMVGMSSVTGRDDDGRRSQTTDTRGGTAYNESLNYQSYGQGEPKQKPDTMTKGSPEGEGIRLQESSGSYQSYGPSPNTRVQTRPGEGMGDTGSNSYGYSGQGTAPDGFTTAGTFGGTGQTYDTKSTFGQGSASIGDTTKSFSYGTTGTSGGASGLTSGQSRANESDYEESRRREESKKDSPENKSK